MFLLPIIPFPANVNSGGPGVITVEFSFFLYIFMYFQNSLELAQLFL